MSPASPRKATQIVSKRHETLARHRSALLRKLASLERPARVALLKVERMWWARQYSADPDNWVALEMLCAINEQLGLNNEKESKK